MTTAVRIVTLGRMDEGTRQLWVSHYAGLEVVENRHPVPSGSRLGRRAFGIGVDSLVAASLARTKRTCPTLATNPWPGAACRVLGIRDLAVTGLYAEPGGRSWRGLLAALGKSPVVCMSEIEADAWRADGGRATPVLWGGTFPEVPRRAPAPGRLRVFVGGTSDRDPARVAALKEEVRADRIAVDLVIADGSGPDAWQGGRSSVRKLPFVRREEFLSELASSDVVYLPLAERARAAGHMVLVAALEYGIPVVMVPIRGMREYVDRANAVVAAPGPVLPQLARAVEEAEPAVLRAAWEEAFSARAHIRAVAGALASMGWPNSNS